MEIIEGMVIGGLVTGIFAVIFNSKIHAKLKAVHEKINKLTLATDNEKNLIINELKNEAKTFLKK
jgi:hypothetical protein